MVAFLQEVLGLTIDHEESGLSAFRLPSGDTFEVFGPGDREHDYFTTGPVVGLVVDDLAAAVGALEGAGVELLGGHRMAPGAVGATSARRTATSTS
jgi:hypothetical protein